VARQQFLGSRSRSYFGRHADPAHAAADITLAGAGAARDAWNASEIPGFCVAVPKVRIPLPPAVSPRLARFCPLTARSRLFARVCGPGRCSVVSRDGYRAVHGADRREYLCRAKFQYRGVEEQWRNEFRLGSGKAELGALLVPAKWQT
jgi:hypothetical protein